VCYWIRIQAILNLPRAELVTDLTSLDRYPWFNVICYLAVRHIVTGRTTQELLIYKHLYGFEVVESIISGKINNMNLYIRSKPSIHPEYWFNM
jgi:hypothetical protein